MENAKENAMKTLRMMLRKTLRQMLRKALSKNIKQTTPSKNAKQKRYAKPKRRGSISCRSPGMRVRALFASRGAVEAARRRSPRAGPQPYHDTTVPRYSRSSGTAVTQAPQERQQRETEKRSRFAGKIHVSLASGSARSFLVSFLFLKNSSE